MFFAFAGYARIATLGEEVKDPTRTIPRAILAALAAAFVIYLGLALLLQWHLPAEQLAGSTAPLLDAVTSSQAQRRRPVRPGGRRGRVPRRAAGTHHRGGPDRHGDGAGTATCPPRSRGWAARTPFPSSPN